MTSKTLTARKQHFASSSLICSNKCTLGKWINMLLRECLTFHSFQLISPLSWQQVGNQNGKLCLSFLITLKYHFSVEATCVSCTNAPLCVQTILRDNALWKWPQSRTIAGSALNRSLSVCGWRLMVKSQTKVCFVISCTDDPPLCISWFTVWFKCWEVCHSHLFQTYVTARRLKFSQKITGQSCLAWGERETK